MPQQSFLLLEPRAGERLRFLDESELILKTSGVDAKDGVIHYEYVAAPAAKGSPQHIHHGHDETFYVVDGEFEFALGTQLMPASAGSFLFVPRGQPHGFRNTGRRMGTIVGTFGAFFAQYFRELAQIIGTTGGPPSPEEWVKLYGRYQTSFYRAP